MKNDSFCKVFYKSGLTKSELAFIYQVSRQTIYDWAKDTAAPQQGGVAHRFVAYTDALVKAIEKGILPMPVSLAKPMRKQRLLSIASQLHDLSKPALPH